MTNNSTPVATGTRVIGDQLYVLQARVRAGIPGWTGSDAQRGWFHFGDPTAAHDAVTTVQMMNDADQQFEYRAVPVAASDVLAAEWTLGLSLTATEVRVVKAALMVEIAALEHRSREQGQPDVWQPALSAARRVFTSLCDRANKHLLDL